MSDRTPDERSQLIREVRQHLESLGRAGLDRIPTPLIPIAPRRSPKAQAAPAAEAPEPADAPAPAPTPVSSAPRVLPAASLFGEQELEHPFVPPEERPGRLATLAAEVAVCERCPHLARARTQTVFGTGSPTARLMFVGEAPGADEDRTGIPFVGRAGQLLTDMITKGMGLTREEVYIANILKSRPPENRDPQPDEIAHCLPYLEQQIAIIRPEFLCLLGRVAAQTLLDTVLSMSRLRGKWHRYRGIPALATYHPSYLLRNPAAKKDAWDDLQILMQAMGITPPIRKRK
jgi:uracil-DNA glycosylase family 4